MSSSSRLHTFVHLGVLLTQYGLRANNPSPSKQPQQIQMFTIRQDGSLTEINSETSWNDIERFGMSPNVTSLKPVDIARLSGKKATSRYTEGQVIRIVALLPRAVDPRQLEFRSFQNRGNIRVAYLGPYNDRSGRGGWSTLSFHAGQLKDGRWVLEPLTIGTRGILLFSNVQQ